MIKMSQYYNINLSLLIGGVFSNALKLIYMYNLVIKSVRI